MTDSPFCLFCIKPPPGWIIDGPARPAKGYRGVGLVAGFGGTLGYGESLIASTVEAVDFVDRILKGAKPADLPMRQATRFILTADMKTASQIGLKTPQSILIRADRVIE